MPIRVNVVGIGPVEFPDGTPDAEMESALKQLEAPAGAAGASAASPMAMPADAQLRAAPQESLPRRAYEAVRETLSPLLGTTERQKARDSIEWGGQHLYKPLGGDVEQSGFFPALSKPTVETPKFQQTRDDGWITGTSKAVANTGLGFVDLATSPLGFATMVAGGPIAGAAPKAVGQGIHQATAAAFAADMGLKAPEAIGQAVTVARDPNAFLGQKIEAGVGAAANTALAGFLGTKAVSGLRMRGNAEARGIEAELGQTGGTPRNTGGTPAPLLLAERTGPIITPPPQGTFGRLRNTLGEVEARLREDALLRDEGDFTAPVRVAEPIPNADAGLTEAMAAGGETPVDVFRRSGIPTAEEQAGLKAELAALQADEISNEANSTPATAELRTGGESNAQEIQRQRQTLLTAEQTDAGPVQMLEESGAPMVDQSRAGAARRTLSAPEEAGGAPNKVSTAPAAPVETPAAPAPTTPPLQPSAAETFPATQSPAVNVRKGTEMPAEAGEAPVGRPIPAPATTASTQRRKGAKAIKAGRAIRKAAQLRAEFVNRIESSVESGVSDYQIQHRPNSEGPRLHNLLEGELAPRDIYEHPEYYTGQPGTRVHRESVSAIRAAKGKPDALVTVYRASPVKNLNAGDWISLSREYSKQHGMADAPEGDVPVHAFRVPAKDVRWAGDAIEEFGYYPEADAVAKLEALKQNPGGEQMAALIPGLDPETWRSIHNTALDVAIGAIKAGRAIREAAEAGWQNLKASLEKLGVKDVDWARLRAEFTQALVEAEPRAGLSQRGTGLLGDENISQAARAGMNPAYERRSNEADQEFARRIIVGAGGPEQAAKAWLAGEFRNEPGAVQTIIGSETQRQLALAEAAKRNAGDTAAADGIVELQRTLANADMQRATELGQAVQAFSVHYGHWSPAAWVKDFREKVVKLAAERVDGSRMPDASGRMPDKTEATPTGVAQGIAQGVADKIEAEGNPKLAKTIREQFGTSPRPSPQGGEGGRKVKTLEERLAEAGAKNPKQTARKVQGFYEKEVRDWRRKHGIPEFDAETEREIIREANRIEQLPADSIQRREAAIKLHDRIMRMKGFEWWELPQDMWYANVLSGFRTHAVNVLANAVNLGAESAVMMVRNPTAIPQIIEALGRALPKSAREAANVLRTGRDTSGREHGSKFDAPGVLERVTNPTASAVLMPWKLVGRALRAEDLAAFYPLQEARAVVLARAQAARDGVPVWKRSAAARKALGWTAEARKRAEAQATSEGLAKGTFLHKRRVSELLENQRPEVLMRNAREFAFDGTFNNDPYGVIGAVADGIKAASARQPAIKFVVPFTKIVANVSNSMMNWTPVGFWRAGRAAGYKLLVGRRSETGKLFGREVTDPQAIGDELVRATVGSVALMAVASAAASRIYDRNPDFAVTGGGPSDPEQKQLLRATGWIPYSVKVGDRYVSYQNTTAGLGLGIVGAYMDAVRYRNLDEQDALNRAAFAFGSAANVVLNSSFLSGLQSIFNQASETGTKHPIRGVPGTVARTAASLAIPNFVKQVDQLFDSTRYAADDVRSMMLAQIPFARREGQPDLNAFGEPVSSPLSKTFTSAASGDLLLRTLAGRRLWPSVPSESGLTSDEHYLVMKLRGPMLRAALTGRLGEITSLPRAEAQALVSQISSQTTQEAMSTLGLDNLAKARRSVQKSQRK